MYLQNPNQKNRKINSSPENSVETFWNKPAIAAAPEEKMIGAPHEMLIPEHLQGVRAHWKAPEYEVYERDRNWYLTMSIILLGIIAWALYTNSPVMAITFILIGVVGYIHLNREPNIFDFIITDEGIVVGREIYEFENIHSFWIFYEAEGKKVISLHMKQGVIPFVQIPVHEEDPVHIREILLDYLPEEKHEEGLAEMLERVLRI